MNSKPGRTPTCGLYSEMVIHGEISQSTAQTSIPYVTTTRLRCCRSTQPGWGLRPLFTSAVRSEPRCRSGTVGTNSAIRSAGEHAGGRRLPCPRARPALYAAAAAPRRLACRQIAARMRVPFDLHDPQCRAAAARDGDRNPGAVLAGRGGSAAGTTSARAGSSGRREYWVTRLQKAEAMWAAAGLPRMELGRVRPAANRRPGAGALRAAARRPRDEQDRHEKRR